MRRNPRYKASLLIVFFLSACLNQLYPQAVLPDTKAFCISRDEIILFNMVNDLRMKNNQPVIRLSKSLCTVARVHIDDLIASQPQSNGCNLNSWSGNGNWTACCNGKDPNGLKCMNSKPREITTYSGSGFELVYWDEETATPAEAYQLWQETDLSKDMILNHAKWQAKSWKAMGVGIRNGYAVIWLGDKADEMADIELCGTDSLIQVKQSVDAVAVKTPKHRETQSRNDPKHPKKPSGEPGKVKKTEDEPKTAGEEIPITSESKKATAESKTVEPPSGVRYFVIIASAKSEKLAKEAVKKAKKEGVTNVTIIGNAPKFRVSAGSYTDEKSAQIRMKELKFRYEDIWLYKQK